MPNAMCSAADMMLASIENNRKVNGAPISEVLDEPMTRPWRADVAAV